MPYLLIDFKSLNDPTFLAKARLIRTSLKDHPYFVGEWPPYVSSLTTLEGSIDVMQGACDAAANRDSLKIKLKNAARKEVEGHLKTIAKHLELVSGGDPEKLKGTGYDLRKQKIKVNNLKALAAPVFSVRHGEVSTTMVGKSSRVPRAGSYQLHFTDGDPTVEEGWKQHGVYTTVSRIDIAGLQPGKTYSFRIRAIGAQGPGPWSMPYTLMAI